MRMHRIYHKKVMSRECSHPSWERERLDHAPRGVAGHGRPCPEGSPARSGGWRGTADRAQRGRLRSLGGGGARHAVPVRVACTPRGVVGHGMPCAEGSPARSGGRRGTADRVRRGRPRSPGRGGARQTVSGGVARAPRGVVGHGMPCPEGSPARSGGCAVPTLNAPQPVLYYFPPDDIASRVSVDHMIAGRSDHGANGD